MVIRTAALVSHSSTTHRAGTKVPMLVAGGLLGNFEVTMVQDSAPGAGSTAPPSKSPIICDPDHGPSGCLQGESQPPPAGDWGGGPGSPQNLGAHPHTGTLALLVLMVDTTAGWYPDAPTDDRHPESDPRRGPGRCCLQRPDALGPALLRGDLGVGTRRRPGLTLQVKNNQPTDRSNLPDGWTTISRRRRTAGTVVDDRWSSNGGDLQTIISRTITDGPLTTADFSDIDVLIVVPFSADARWRGASASSGRTPTPRS